MFFNPIFFNPMFFNSIFFNPIFFNPMFFDPMFFNSIFFNPIFFYWKLKIENWNFLAGAKTVKRKIKLKNKLMYILQKLTRRYFKRLS